MKKIAKRGFRYLSAKKSGDWAKGAVGNLGNLGAMTSTLNSLLGPDDEDDDEEERPAKKSKTTAQKGKGKAAQRKGAG